jgi:hypothetical protein
LICFDSCFANPHPPSADEISNNSPPAFAGDFFLSGRNVLRSPEATGGEMLRILESKNGASQFVFIIVKKLSQLIF